MNDIFDIKPGERVAVMGVGNILCSDDAAGMAFAEKIKKRAEKSGALVMEASTAPENFSGVIRQFKPDVLYIVDAAGMEAPVGTVDKIKNENIGGTAFSTHMLPLSFLISYMRSCFECRVVIIGIQPASIEPGGTMCGQVSEAVKKLAEDFISVMDSCDAQT